MTAEAGPASDSTRFRAHVRDWLAAHGPAAPLPSVDTAEGFARHRAWERELHAAALTLTDQGASTAPPSPAEDGPG